MTNVKFKGFIRIKKIIHANILHEEWIEDCLKYRGEILKGEHGHYCHEFDGLPVDETCPEWEVCLCIEKKEEGGKLCKK